MKKDNKQRLFEVMGKLDPTFKPNAQLLNEWNFDKKKGEDEEEKKSEEPEEEKKEGSEKKVWNFEKKKGEKDDDKEEKKSEEPEEENEEDEDKKELKEVENNEGKNIPVGCWDKAKTGKK